MPAWLWLALIPPALWAASNFVDKWLLERYIRDPFAYQMLLALLDFLALPFFLLFVKINTAAWLVIPSIAASAMMYFAFVLYNKALLCEETSRVATLIYIGPVFVLPLAAVFLGEVLTAGKYIGVFLLVAGAVLISYRKTGGRGMLSPALLLMLMFSFVWAVYEVLAKWILKSMDLLSFTFWFGVGSVMMGCLTALMPGMRKRLTNSIGNLDAKAWTIRIAFTCIWFISLVLMFWAISLGPVSLVAALPSTQPFYALVFAFVLTAAMPHIIREKLDMGAGALKLLAVILVILGTCLVAV